MTDATTFEPEAAAGGLALNADFPECPGREFGRRFEAFARETGWPERFPGLSTTKPPEETREIQVLSDPISVNRKKRNGVGVPCPVCSPGKPKWLDGGLLIWCAEPAAIYLIGPTCGSTGWARNVAQALNSFQLDDRARRNAARLAVEVRLAPDRLAWIKAARPRLDRVEALQQDLGRTFPKLRRSLFLAGKSGDAIWDVLDGALQNLGRIRGAEFLTSTWRFASAMDRASEVFTALHGASGSDDPLAWAKALAPEACAERVKEVDQALKLLRDAQQKTAQAAAFLSDETTVTLARVSRAWTGPNAFTVPHTRTAIEIRSGDRFWRGPLGEIRPLPTVSDVDPAEVEATLG